MLVPKSIFAVRKIADRASSRYALGGIRFERDEKTAAPFAVACDGRRLVAATWNEDDAEKYPAAPGIVVGSRPEGQPFILPYAACDAAAKVKLASVAARQKPILQNVILQEPLAGENDVKIFATDCENQHNTTAKQLDGRFPRWRDVVPAYGKGDISICIDARFLRECAEVLEAVAGSDESRAVVLTISREDRRHEMPLMLTARNAATGAAALAVIVPLASDDKKNGPKPAWQFHPDPQAAEVEPEADQPAADEDAEPIDEPTDTEPAAEVDTELEPVSPPAIEPAAEPPIVAEVVEAIAVEVVAAETMAEPEPPPYIDPPPARRESSRDDWRTAARRIACAAYV